MQKTTVGQSISILFYVEDRPVAVNATVSSLEPFAMSSTDPSADWLAQGRRAMLIARSSEDFSKGEANLKAVKRETGWHIHASDFGWEHVDRRRYPRFSVALPVTVRAVIESDGVAELKFIEATTEDMSLGGAWLKSDETMPQNVLVEFQCTLPTGAHLRVLSDVKWSETADKTGFGVEFIDFLSGTRHSLQQYFAKVA